MVMRTSVAVVDGGGSIRPGVKDVQIVPLRVGVQRPGGMGYIQSDGRGVGGCHKSLGRMWCGIVIVQSRAGPPP